MAFNVGDLLLILHWDESGPMETCPPGLVINRYEAVPRAYLNDHETNEEIFGSGVQIVYDVLLDGELEISISESWLSALADPLRPLET
jgi:hypothetical protein